VKGLAVLLAAVVEAYGLIRRLRERRRR
jgi:hypothetical protein